MTRIRGTGNDTVHVAYHFLNAPGNVGADSYTRGLHIGVVRTFISAAGQINIPGDDCGQHGTADHQG